MKRAYKVAGATLAIVVVIAAALIAGALWLGERKRQREVLVKVVPIAYATGPAALKQGRYLFETRGCAHCHGGDGSGRVLANDPGGMYIRTPNITRGPGGVAANYTEADWVRAIRHGVNPQGRGILIMPSELYNRLNDADFAALIAYVRSLPPIAGEPPELRMPPIMKALYGLGVVKDASEKIDHALPPPPVTPVAGNAEHGRYVARICMGCHGETLAGGRPKDGPPHGPEPANLTPGTGTVMTRYDTQQKFAALMRTGKRPDGSPVEMPSDMLAAFDDTDVAAIYAYLKTLPPRPTGQR